MKNDVFARLSLGNTTVASSTQLEAAVACIKLYKLEKNECGEVCLSSTIAPFAIQFGGVTEGTCANQVSVGPFGTFDTDLYTKFSFYFDLSLFNQNIETHVYVEKNLKSKCYLKIISTERQLLHSNM